LHGAEPNSDVRALAVRGRADVVRRRLAPAVRRLCPWKATYCSRLNRSSTVPRTPASRLKSAIAALSTSTPPTQRNVAWQMADARGRG
jgi:hypothetical protein